MIMLLQGNDLARRLQADDKAGTVPKALYNHYTVIMSDEKNGYSQVANVSFFAEIAEIISCFDAWIAGESSLVVTAVYRMWNGKRATFHLFKMDVCSNRIQMPKLSFGS